MKQQLCKKYNLTEDQFYGREPVGGSLDLGGLTSIPDGFNPTVGGGLYLGGLTSIPDGFNPTVGGSLDLGGLTSIPDGFNPTVGCYLYLGGQTTKKTPLPNGFIFTWQNGKYAMYDGILCEVISRKKGVMKIKIVGKRSYSYLAVDGEFSAHGDTIKKAVEDLRYKKVANKLRHEPIGPDTVITPQYYHIITGACEQGISNWMAQNNVKKDKVKAKDLLPLLEKTNAYGVGRFRELMNNR